MNHWRNSHQTYGRISRALHWGMGLAILGMLVFGLQLAAMQPSFDTIWMYTAHKTIGLLLLALLIARLIWHRISPPPAALPGPGWQAGAARWGHRALYALMLGIPACGWVASAASGLDVMLFGRIALPPIAPVSEALETAAFTAHAILSRLLMAMIALHVAAAFWHQFRLRDGTLTRMTHGQPPREIRPRP